MVNTEELINWLEEEIEHHKEKENAATMPWDRGFHNGAFTEAGRLKIKIRELELKSRRE